MKRLTLLLPLLLVGCAGEEYKEADGKILCDPASADAYRVEHHLAAMSLVTRMPTADRLCRPDDENGGTP